MFLSRALFLLSLCCLQPWVSGRKLISRADPGSPDAIDQLLDQFPLDSPVPDAIDQLLDQFPLDPPAPDAIDQLLDQFPLDPMDPDSIDHAAGEIDQFLAQRPRYEEWVLGEGYRRTCQNLPQDHEGCGVLPLPEWTNDQLTGVCHDLQRYVPAVHYPYPRIDNAHPQDIAESSEWNQQGLLAWQRGTLNNAVQDCLEQPPAQPIQAEGSPIEEVIRSCDQEPAITPHVERRCLMSNDHADSCMVPMPVYNDATKTYKGFQVSFENRSPAVPGTHTGFGGYVLVHWTLAGAWVYTIPGKEVDRYEVAISNRNQGVVAELRDKIVRDYHAALKRALDRDLKGVQVRGIVLHANFHAISSDRWDLFKRLLRVFQLLTKENGYTVDKVGLSTAGRDERRVVGIQCVHSPNLEQFGPNTAGSVCDFHSPQKQERIWAFVVEQRPYLGSHRSRTIRGPRKREINIQAMQHFVPRGFRELPIAELSHYQP